VSIFWAILKALSAGFSIFQKERELYNNPEIVKNKLAQQNQEAKDAVNKADAVLANPNASEAEHKKALDELRRAMS
jgi:hypothetical protein